MRTFCFRGLLISSLVMLSPVVHADSPQCTNFYPEEGPLYSANYAVGGGFDSDQLKFVSYNVNLLEKQELVQEDLAKIHDLQDADFILLQEAAGLEHGPTNFVEPIAKELSMNYVFAPSMTLWGKDYGNAVLSRWPILSVKKVFLPRSDREKCNLRTALEVLVQVGDRQILVTSVHLSTRFSDSLTGGDGMRAAQLKVAMDSLAQQTQYPRFISGDLNSFTQAGLKKIFKLTSKYGFTNARPVNGYTFPQLRFDLDHAFSRGFAVISDGIATSAKGSDHYPIWTVLQLTR